MNVRALRHKRRRLSTIPAHLSAGFFKETASSLGVARQGGVRAPMQVSHGPNHNGFAFNRVINAKWKPADQIAAMIVPNDSPCFRISQNNLDATFNLIDKIFAQTWDLTAVISSCGDQFRQGLVSEAMLHLSRPHAPGALLLRHPRVWSCQ